MCMMLHSYHVPLHPLLEFIIIAEVVIHPTLHVPRMFEASHASDASGEGGVRRRFVEPMCVRQEGRCLQLQLWHEQVVRLQRETHVQGTVGTVSVTAVELVDAAVQSHARGRSRSVDNRAADDGVFAAENVLWEVPIAGVDEPGAGVGCRYSQGDPGAIVSQSR